MGKLYTGPTSGLWTPAISFVTPGDLSVAYTYQMGEWYLRDGLVTAFCTVQTSTFTHTTASGFFRMTGLPFTSKTRANFSWPGQLSYFRGFTKASYTQFHWWVASNSSTAFFQASGSGVSESLLTSAEVPTAGVKILIGSITYPVA